MLIRDVDTDAIYFGDLDKDFPTDGTKVYARVVEKIVDEYGNKKAFWRPATEDEMTDWGNGRKSRPGEVRYVYAADDLESAKPAPAIASDPENVVDTDPNAPSFADYKAWLANQNHYPSSGDPSTYSGMPGFAPTTVATDPTLNPQVPIVTPKVD